MEIQLAALLAAVTFSTFITRFIRQADMTGDLRLDLSARAEWLGRLIACPHCLCFWLALLAAAALAHNWLNFALMLLLGWRGGYYLNRLLDNIGTATTRRPAAERNCHVCSKAYERGFLERMDLYFCSYRCWFDYLKQQRQLARPVFDESGNFALQEIYPMSFENVDPTRAHQLLESGENYVYIDVRSIPEYEAGHPAGAVNIPIMHREPAGMVPNPDFVRVVESNFDRNTRLLIGCQSGQRSQRAAQALIAAGFTVVANVKGGFGGARTMSGQVVEKGWAELGYPVAYGAEEGKDYPSMVAGTGR